MERKYESFCDELIKSFAKRGVELDWDNDIEEDNSVYFEFFRWFTNDGEKVPWVFHLDFDEDGKIEPDEDNEVKIEIYQRCGYMVLGGGQTLINVDYNCDELRDKILTTVDDCNVCGGEVLQGLW